MALKALALTYIYRLSLSVISFVTKNLSSDKFEADVTKVWNYESSVEQYQTVGGTSRNSVLLQIESLYTWLDQSNKI